MSVQILAPVSGRVLPLAEVPDPVFAGKLLGDGLAIEPSDGLVVAPVTGEVVALFPTGHAVGIRTTEGVEVLVHIGIDSSKLAGVFEPLVAQGDLVTVGQPVVRFDLGALRAQAASVVTPVIVLASPAGMRVVVGTVAEVQAGATPLFALVASGE